MSSYTQALLKRDASIEALMEEKELRAAERARQKQSRNQKIWGTVGSIIGMYFGPAGSFVGKQIGKFGADLFNNAEDKKVHGGKFYKDEAAKINKQLSDYDRSENIGNVVGMATDAAKAFALGGGFEAVKGGESFASAVTNKDYWTKFGGETPNMYDFFKNNEGASVGDYFNMLRGSTPGGENNPIQFDAIDVYGGK